MTDPVDPGRRDTGNPFDDKDGLYGQTYSEAREKALGEKLPSGTVDARPGDAAPAADPALPPDNGRRASFDPKTGAVHGSGASAGGGNPGEDMASDSAAGDGYPLTGGEGKAKGRPDDLGPAHFKE